MRNPSFKVLALVPFFFVVTSSLFSQEKEVHQSKFRKWMIEKPKGLYNVTTFDFNLSTPPVLNGMQTTFGYKFNPFIGVGAGIGIERFYHIQMYQTFITNLTMMPVFGEVRYTILQKRITPVVALKGGYRFLINYPYTQVSRWTEDIFPGYAWNTYEVYSEYTQGGFAYGVEAGVKARINERLSLYLSAEFTQWSVSGYYYKWTYQHLSAPGGQPSDKTSYFYLPTIAYNEVLYIRFGITF